MVSHHHNNNNNSSSNNRNNNSSNNHSSSSNNRSKHGKRDGQLPRRTHCHPALRVLPNFRQDTCSNPDNSHLDEEVFLRSPVSLPVHNWQWRSTSYRTRIV